MNHKNTIRSLVFLTGSLFLGEALAQEEGLERKINCEELAAEAWKNRELIKEDLRVGAGKRSAPSNDELDEYCYNGVEEPERIFECEGIGRFKGLDMFFRQSLEQHLNVMNQTQIKKMVSNFICYKEGLEAYIKKLEKLEGKTALSTIVDAGIISGDYLLEVIKSGLRTLVESPSFFPDDPFFKKVYEQPTTWKIGRSPYKEVIAGISLSNITDLNYVKQKLKEELSKEVEPKGEYSPQFGVNIYIQSSNMPMLPFLDYEKLAKADPSFIDYLIEQTKDIYVQIYGLRFCSNKKILEKYANNVEPIYFSGLFYPVDVNDERRLVAEKRLKELEENSKKQEGNKK